jgi:hypothetical protein
MPLLLLLLLLMLRVWSLQGTVRATPAGRWACSIRPGRRRCFRQRACSPGTMRRAGGLQLPAPSWWRLQRSGWPAQREAPAPPAAALCGRACPRQSWRTAWRAAGRTPAATWRGPGLQPQPWPPARRRAACTIRHWCQCVARQSLGPSWTISFSVCPAAVQSAQGGTNTRYNEDALLHNSTEPQVAPAPFGCHDRLPCSISSGAG